MDGATDKSPEPGLRGVVRLIAQSEGYTNQALLPTLVDKMECQVILTT